MRFESALGNRDTLVDCWILGIFRATFSKQRPCSNPRPNVSEFQSKQIVRNPILFEIGGSRDATIVDVMQCICILLNNKCGSLCRRTPNHSGIYTNYEIPASSIDRCELTGATTCNLHNCAPQSHVINAVLRVNFTRNASSSSSSFGVGARQMAAVATTATAAAHRNFTLYGHSKKKTNEVAN